MPEERMEFRHVAPFEVTRSAADGDGLTMEGYASVFDSPIEIDSWEGRFVETIQRGAFAKTIRERNPVLMFNHGQHPMIGDMPIGAIRSLREDSKGLFVSARLSDNWLVEPVREAIAGGSISGMSFRMQVVNDQWKAGTPRMRTITEVRCLELGPVVFPAYTDTTVSVRSQQIAAELADPEIRAELARIFTLGTTLDRADGEAVTPSEAAAGSTQEPEPAQTTPRVTDRERRIRALQIRGVIPS